MDQIVYIIITALITVANSVALWLLWRELKRSQQRTEQLHTSQQRQSREISQHRYSIALISQTQKNNENKSKKKNGSSDTAIDEIVFTDQDVDAAIEELIGDEGKGQVEEKTGEAFDSMKDNEVLEFVKKAVRNNQIALAQQPVVILPERQTAYYEIFSRIHVPGQGYIPAHKYISVAKNNNLVGALDNMLLLRCLQMLKDRAEKESNLEFFINTNSQTFINKDYLSGLIKFLAANPRLSSKLIFEMSQEDWLNITTSIKTVLDNLSLLGCRFSMDQVNILGMDMARMMKQNISFVKLDANILIKEIEAHGDVARIKRIKNSLDAQRINVILEKVENEKQLVTLLDLRPDFGQGFLFGAPGIIE